MSSRSESSSPDGSQTSAAAPPPPPPEVDGIVALTDRDEVKDTVGPPVEIASFAAACRGAAR